MIRAVCIEFLRGSCRRRTAPHSPRMILDASASDATLLKVNVENLNLKRRTVMATDDKRVDFSYKLTSTMRRDEMNSY